MKKLLAAIFAGLFAVAVASPVTAQDKKKVEKKAKVEKKTAAMETKTEKTEGKAAKKKGEQKKMAKGAGKKKEK